MSDIYDFVFHSFLHGKEDLTNSYKRGNKMMRVKIYNSGEKVEDSRGYLGEEVAEGMTTSFCFFF